MDSGALGASCCITESLRLRMLGGKGGLRTAVSHANCTAAAQESQLSHIEFFKRRSLKVAVFFSPPPVPSAAECLETCNGFKIAPFGDAADAAMGDTREWRKQTEEVPAQLQTTYDSVLSSGCHDAAEPFHTFLFFTSENF